MTKARVRQEQTCGQNSNRCTSHAESRFYIISAAVDLALRPSESSTWSPLNGDTGGEGEGVYDLELDKTWSLYSCILYWTTVIAFGCGASGKGDRQAGRGSGHSGPLTGGKCTSSGQGKGPFRLDNS